MIQKSHKLSIVCPAYEEEEVLPFFHEELSSVLACLQTAYDVEIIYVDDGSRDGTLQVIKTLARSDRRIRYLSFSRNFGHQAALTAGLEHATGDVIVMMDSDLQHPPAVIPALLEKWHAGSDIVLTVRDENPHLTWFKRSTSQWFYQVMALVSDTEIRMAAADFRLMSRRAVEGLLQMREAHRFLRGMVQWLGFPTAEVHFKPASRKAGVTKYTVGRLLSFALDAVLSFSKVPLRLSLALGLLSFLFAVLFSGYTAVRWCVGPSGPPPGWAFLLISLYLVGGCILVGVGLVGEYVGRIYDQVKARPIYLLKDRFVENPALSLRLKYEEPPARQASLERKKNVSAA